jgi:serine O-acetyltransferase
MQRSSLHLMTSPRSVRRRSETVPRPSPAARPREEVSGPSHDDPLPAGDTDQNPRDIGLLPLLLEDLRTYDGNPLEPGFLAVALHRLGNARMAIRSRMLRAPLSLAYRAAFMGVDLLYGIDLPYNVKLGRRVRIWHHGGIVLSARAIGDDVHIRQQTTFGVVRRGENTKKPIIGSRVDIGVGACVLGPVTVGDDCVIGANAVVVRDVPAGCTAVGVPARPRPQSSLARAARYGSGQQTLRD